MNENQDDHSNNATQGDRPWDQIVRNGPPANPIEFGNPRLETGRRGNVVVFLDHLGEHRLAENVLFRYDAERPERGLGQVKQAYWPLPPERLNRPINTIMGHIEICFVLTRRIRGEKSDYKGSMSANDVDDNDIVFQATSNYVAVKVNYFTRMDEKRDHPEDPFKEIAAMQVIGNTHPHVLGALEVLFDDYNLYVVMPYCRSGDMFDMVQNYPTGLDEGVARYWFRRLLSGIEHLHSVGICHRDLSLENTMIDNDNCLIIDMGMAIQVPYTDPIDPRNVVTKSHGTGKRLIFRQQACGKLPYMSPEIYQNQDPFDGGAVDIWSAGSMLFLLLTGKHPYQLPCMTDECFNFWSQFGLRRLLEVWKVMLSEDCLDLLEKILRIDPRMRLTLEEVRSHPWMQLPDVEPQLT